MKGKNHLADAQAELARLSAAPLTEESRRRILDLEAIISEHSVGNQTTRFA
jgi:hypothetical protein